MDQRTELQVLPEDLRSVITDELLQNPFMGINITDGEGRVLFLNRTHRKITGHEPAQYAGKTMAQIVEEGLISESATLITLATGEEALINQESSCKNQFFQVKAIPIKDGQGRIRYVINYLLGISDLVKLRNDLAQVQSHNEMLQKRLNRFGELVYQSKVMKNVVEAALRVAEHDVSLLITGPSGTGKEMIANLVQSYSGRSQRPFVKINCAAIPEQLLESELFGYEPGTFTGGSPKGKKGLIESAHTGTLLLDEIGELPLGLQAKLLRVLQNHRVRHIGASTDIDVDFRLIASTNADLKEMVRRRAFREDLYYRVNVIEIKVPPLEERREDIVLLVDYFLHRFNEKYGTAKTIQKDAMRYLGTCRYPGNVRELCNVVERTVVMSVGDEITLADAKESAGYLMMGGQTDPAALPAAPAVEEGRSLRELMDAYEKRLLTEYQKKFQNGVKMAEALQTDQSTISRKLKRYQIEAK